MNIPKSKKIFLNAKPFDDIIWHNKKYKMRVDIGDYCKDIYEANIRRIIQLNGSYYTKYNSYLDDITTIDKDGILFAPNTEIYIQYNIDKNLLNYAKQQSIQVISNNEYIKLQNKYKHSIPLWETFQQNVDNNPDLYKHKWVIGKRELKRQYKKFFCPHGQIVKIGQLWQHQPWTGRPFYNSMYLDNFKIYTDQNIIFEFNEWGPIVMAIRRYLKDHVNEYYNTNKYVYCAGRIRKTQEWIDIVKYDAINNYYLNIDYFIPAYTWQSKIINEENRKKRKHLPYDIRKLSKYNLTNADKIEIESLDYKFTSLK